MNGVRVQVEGLELDARVIGEGPPLLLIAGLGATKSSWYRLEPLLAKHFQLISFDNRGAGVSDKPNVPYSMAMLADDARRLAAKLGYQKSLVFGVSMGGMIAQELALRHPEAVDGLVLGSTFCGGDRSAWPTWSDLASMLWVRRQTEEELTRGVLRLLYSERSRRERAAEIAADVAQNPPSTPAWAFLRQFQAIARHDTCGRLKRFAKPTLILHGSEDRLVPVANAHRLARLLPSATLRVFDQCGHAFFLEEPDEVARLVCEFYERL